MKNEESSNRSVIPKKASASGSPRAKKSDLEFTTNGGSCYEFEAILEYLSGPCPAHQVKQSSKHQAKPKQTNITSSPQKIKNRVWYSSLTKAPKGLFESDVTGVLEKHFIARVQYIPADEAGFKDVLIASDKPLPKQLKIGQQLLKITSVDDVN